MTRVSLAYSSLKGASGLLAAALVLGLAGQAAAQQGKGSNLPFGSIFRGPGLTTTVPEPADWVRKSRPPEGELYDRRGRVPAGEPERGAMNPDEVRRVEGELNALRSRHDRAGGRSSGQQGRSAAAQPQPRNNKARPPCVLTCNIGLGSINQK
ncbi:MAG: hypothetical protein AB7F96_17000 [Beijerinckiaceae bacterium]